MSPVPVLMTAEELLENPVPHMRTELVNGRLIVREPAEWLHGDVAARVLVAISTHLTAERTALGLSAPRGRVLAAETGFTLRRGPDTVRAPDVAYVSAARIPTDVPRGFAEFAPDLAVEVLSPGDRAGEVLAKVGDWLNAGSRLVWVIDPARRQARVYRADGSETIIAADEPEGGLLDGEEPLPGLSISLCDMLD